MVDRDTVQKVAGTPNIMPSCQAKKTTAKGRVLPKLELQALVEEYVGRMVHSGRGGGLNSRPCLWGRSDILSKSA